MKEQNATATKLRQQEELTELNEVKTGMDKLAKEDAKVNEERTEEGIQDKKVLAKQAAQKAKMEKDMGAAKAKFAQKEKKEEGNVNKEKDLSERERVVKVGEEQVKAKGAGRSPRTVRSKNGEQERVITEGFADSETVPQMLVEVESSHRRNHRRAGRKHMNRASSHKNLAAETYLVPEKNIYGLNEHRFRELNMAKTV